LRTVSRRGRFGKYGETKRLERLRRSRLSRRMAGAGGRAFPSASGRAIGAGRKSAAPFVRSSLESDAPFIEALSRRVFTRYGGTYGEILSAWFGHRFGITLVAILGRSRAGFVMMGPVDENGRLPCTVEILAIAVEPRFQGMGVGRRLLSEALKKARIGGARSVVVHTAEENLAALKLFESFGLVPLGLKESFYPEGQNAYLMIRSIEG